MSHTEGGPGQRIEGRLTSNSHRALLIVNPASGRRDPGETRAALEDRFLREQLPVDVRETKQAGDALSWAQSAEEEGYDLVVAAGGDGTIMEAMSGLIKGGSRVPLAQIPTGTANLLARALGIPTTPEAAIDMIFSGHAARFDVGYVPEEDRYFALVAGAGYDARLIADASRDLKNILGFGAYLLTGIKHLFTLRKSRIDLEIDGRRRRLRAHTIMIMNVGEIDALGLAIGPEIEPHDGKLDIMIVSSATVWGALNVLLRLLTRQFHGHSDIEYLKATHITVAATPPLPTQLDGESLGTTPLAVEAIADGALLIVPRDYEERSVKA